MAQQSPDPKLTPGAYDSAVTQETISKTICDSGYTKIVRDVTEDTKREVAQRYGLTWPLPEGAYEIDHWIPLEVGGANDITNLWPQPAKPSDGGPGFHQKDVVETWFKRQVCEGKMTLDAARTAIPDWPKTYEQIKDTEKK
jgi:hypothetical protein